MGTEQHRGVAAHKGNGAGSARVGEWEKGLTGRKHPRQQIPTLPDLFQGQRPDIPWVDAIPVKKPNREETGMQGKLFSLSRLACSH